VNINARTTRNSRYAKFSHRLAKIAQTAQNKHATGNAIVAMATLTRVKIAASRDFFVKSRLAATYTISKLTTSSESQQRDVFNDILSVRKYSELFTHELNTFLF